MYFGQDASVETVTVECCIPALNYVAVILKIVRVHFCEFVTCHFVFAVCIDMFTATSVIN